MITEKEIMTRLQNGESIDKIAAELTKTLDAANKAYKAEQEKSNKKQDKIDDMTDLLEDLRNYLVRYYSDYESYINEGFDEFDAEDIVDDLDELLECVDALSSLTDAVKDIKSDGNKAKKGMTSTDINKMMDGIAFKMDDVKFNKIKGRTADQILRDFLKSNRW